MVAIIAATVRPWFSETRRMAHARAERPAVPRASGTETPLFLPSSALFTGSACMDSWGTMPLSFRKLCTIRPRARESWWASSPRCVTSIAGGWLGDPFPPRIVLCAAFVCISVLGYLFFQPGCFGPDARNLSCIYGVVGSAVLYVCLAAYHVKSLQSGLSSKGSGMFVTSLYGGAAFGGYLIRALASHGVGYSLERFRCRCCAPSARFSPWRCSPEKWQPRQKRNTFAELKLVMLAAQSSLSENPAWELLLLCARRQIGADTSKRILAIASGQPDWNALLAAASEHTLTSLVCKNLQDCAPAALPAPWRERFARSYFECSCRNLALTAELFRVLAALESCGVSATPYKGPVLAAQAYGDVALREFSDLDIIVPQRQIVAAHEALLDLGFCPEIAAIEPSQSPRRTPGQYAYRNGAGTPWKLVELHTERTLRYFPAALDLQALCTRRQPITLAGRQVLTFSAEDTLLLLSVHGSKHLWDRLSWIADIAALTARSHPLETRLGVRAGACPELARSAHAAVGGGTRCASPRSGSAR